jgi:hypothetical protein
MRICIGVAFISQSYDDVLYLCNSILLLTITNVITTNDLKVPITILIGNTV